MDEDDFLRWHADHHRRGRMRVDVVLVVLIIAILLLAVALFWRPM